MAEVNILKRNEIMHYSSFTSFSLIIIESYFLGGNQFQDLNLKCIYTCVCVCIYKHFHRLLFGENANGLKSPKS